MIYYKHYSFVFKGKTYKLSVCNYPLELGFNDVGWALCSPKDTYTRKKGNVIALSRLKNSPLVISMPEGVLTSRFIRDRIFDLLVFDGLREILPNVDQFLKKNRSAFTLRGVK